MWMRWYTLKFRCWSLLRFKTCQNPYEISLLRLFGSDMIWLYVNIFYLDLFGILWLNPFYLLWVLAYIIYAFWFLDSPYATWGMLIHRWAMARGTSDVGHFFRNRYWLVVWNIFYFSVCWEEYSQLNFIFFRGAETTNQGTNHPISQQYAILTYSPMLCPYLALKCTKCKNAKSGAITLIWRKAAQKVKISQMSICFFEDTGTYDILWWFPMLLLFSHRDFLNTAVFAAQEVGTRVWPFPSAGSCLHARRQVRDRPRARVPHLGPQIAPHNVGPPLDS